MSISKLGLPFVLAAVLVGCGGESTAPKSIAYVGTYTLVRVDDAQLPVLYFGADDTSTDLMITGGTFTLQADNSFTDTVYVSQSYPGNGVKQLYTIIANGTYTVVGSRLTITPTGNNFRFYSPPLVGAVETENLNIYLSIRADEKLYLYRKTP